MTQVSLNDRIQENVTGKEIDDELLWPMGVVLPESGIKIRTGYDKSSQIFLLEVNSRPFLEIPYKGTPAVNDSKSPRI